MIVKPSERKFYEYNMACRKLVMNFLDEYFRDYWDDAYMIGQGSVQDMSIDSDWTELLCINEDFYSIQTMATCYQYQISLEDLVSYNDFCIKCYFEGKNPDMNLKNWAQYPNNRPKIEDCTERTEVTLSNLLRKTLPALEGITHYEELVNNIKRELKPWIT